MCPESHIDLLKEVIETKYASRATNICVGLTPTSLSFWINLGSNLYWSFSLVDSLFLPQQVVSNTMADDAGHSNW